MNSFMYIQKLCFHTSLTVNKIAVKNIKGKSQSSQSWIKRQLSDPYVKQAKYHNFRCRSAFKLLELNEKCQFLDAGMFVIDCGAAPGSWSQVAATLTNSNNKKPDDRRGRVIGIDLRGISPVEGVEFLFPYDITSPVTHKKLKEIIGNEQVDVVLSDIAPNSTGMKEMDHDAIIEVGYSVLRFALINSKPGGTCVIKLFDGRSLKKITEDARKYYDDVRIRRPDATRTDSLECYLVARYFKGLGNQS